MITAPIRINARGTGYVAQADGKTNKRDSNELEISKDNLGTALPGDTVVVKIQGRNGVVMRVVDRARTRFVGTVIEEEGERRVLADDKRVYVHFKLSDKKTPALGTKVQIEIGEWKDSSKLPEAKIIKELGIAGEHETEISAILYSSGFEYDFPPPAEREAKTAEENFSETVKKEASVRKDFRGVTTFTIDPVSAKDFDDALSVREISEGLWEVGVHIADVAYFVSPGTALDQIARERATSVYMVDRTVPMLPEALSANICSLRPDEDRLAYSSVFEINQKGEIRKEWFGRTLIRSDKRFSYQEAQEVIDKNDGIFLKELLVLQKIAHSLKTERIKVGSILFDKEEVEVKLDSNDEPESISIKPHYGTQDLIEEWMLLANKRVAEFMTRAIGAKKFPGFVYRVHDRPDRERIDSLALFLKGIGKDFLGGKSKVTGTDLNRLFRAVHGLEMEGLIKHAALRSMAKAIYTTKNIGHFGLAFPDYTHFTSPIRRYPDVCVHRLLDLYLTHKNLPGDAMISYEKILKHSSEKEREAEKAERDSVKWMQAKYMQKQIGKEFTGMVTGVTDWGLYVEEETTKSSGLVHVRSLGNDYFEFDEKKYELRARGGKQKFRLGDKVKIKVLSADPDQKSIDYELVK